MISPQEWARQKYREAVDKRRADQEALKNARANAETTARQRWANQKAKQEADNRYGLGKNKPKGFFGSIFPKETTHRKSKRSKVYRDQQPRGGGLTSMPDIDWGVGGVDLDLGFGGGRRKRRGGVDLGF